MALKLATGAGKTAVMAMLIAWQTVNAVRRPGSNTFTRGFLVVTPGLTVRDRLRVLNPHDPDNYYATRELVPSDMLADLKQALIVITNYHTLRLRERIEISKGGRNLLKGQTGPEPQTLETEGQMLRRVMPELMGVKNLLVLNDEAHHCYRAKPGPSDEGKLTGDDRKEAERNSKAAQLWITGLETVHRRLRMKWTPFFRPGVKVVKQACSIKKGAAKSEEKSYEAQPCFQGESCLGGTTRAGDSGGTIPPAQGSREPDLQMEAAAFGERHACFRDRRGGRRRCLDARGRTASENRGADDGARFFITRARSIAMTPRRELVEPNAPLSMRWQCELLGVNRSSLYYEPVEPDGEQLALMRRMDELHLKHPFFGSRMMTQTLKAEGSAVNRKRVQRLMRLMGLESTAPKRTQASQRRNTPYTLIY